MLMKRRPFLMASMTIAAIFLTFLMLVYATGLLGDRASVVPTGKKIGVLEVFGVIVDAQQLVERIDSMREDDSVKAVVLRINSPGGGVAPSQEIHAELKKLAEEKPLIVSMGAVAASGGYYLAIAGERLFANPGSITGSIGVIMSFPDYRELLGKIGVKTEVVKSGQFKDIGSSSREFTEADRALLQGMIDDVHAQFVEAISEGRNIPVERLQPYVDGRIFSGRQALEIGLIDELGTQGDAIRYAAKITGLGDEPALLYPEPEHDGLLKKLIQGMAGRFLGSELTRDRSFGPQFLWNEY